MFLHTNKYKKTLLLFFSIFITFALTVLMFSALHASFLPAETVSPSSQKRFGFITTTVTPSSTLNISQTQKLQELELDVAVERLDIIQEQVDRISQFRLDRTLFWEGFFNFLFLATILITFRKPLSNLLNSVSTNLGRASFEVAGVKWSIRELDQAIVDREILRISLLIATIDDDYDEKEIDFLLSKSEAMIPSKDKMKNLPKETKQRIIVEAISMAAIDRKIKNEEYEAIKSTAEILDLKVEIVDKLIVEKCYRTREKNPITPPEKLQEAYSVYEQKIKSKGN